MKNKNNKLRNTLKISIIEGIFAQIYVALSYVNSAFISKFAVLLNASSMQLSFLGAIAQISQIFQPLGLVLSQKEQHLKQKCLRFCYLGRSITLFLGIAWLFFAPAYGIIILLGLLLVSTIFQNIADNMWIAWISNSVPLRFRGRFFSYRNQYLIGFSLVITTFVTLVIDLFQPKAGSLAEKILHFLPKTTIFGQQNLGYALSITFFLAAVVGLIGIRILAKQPERPKKATNYTLKQIFSIPLKDKNYKRLLVFQLWWMFAIGIGAPFWVPTMIKILKMSMLEIQIYGIIASVASILSFKVWGKVIDKFGNKTAMKAIIALGGTNPLLWLLFSESNYKLIWFEAVSGGIMWGGAGIVTMNFVLSIAPKSKEQIYSGVNGAFSGAGMMLSALLSGVLLSANFTIPGFDFLPEQTLFAIGGIARFSAIIPLIFVKEKRYVPLKIVFKNFNAFVKVKVINLKAWMFKK